MKTTHSRVWFVALDGVSLCRMDRTALAPLYCPQSVRQSIGFAFHSASQSAFRFWTTATCHCGLVKPFRWQLHPKSSIPKQLSSRTDSGAPDGLQLRNVDTDCGTSEPQSETLNRQMRIPRCEVSSESGFVPPAAGSAIR